MEIAGQTLTTFDPFPELCIYCGERDHGTAACNPPAGKIVFRKPYVKTALEVNTKDTGRSSYHEPIFEPSLLPSMSKS